MKMKKRITALVLSVMAVLPLMPARGLAAGSIDTGHEVKLTISYQDGNTALSGAAFDIFRVAAVDANGGLTPAAPFDQFHVDIRGKNDAAWKTLASTLEGYVLRDDIAPADSGKTDKQGLLTFPDQIKRLEPGLYLVLGRRHTQGGRIYDAAPFMVLLPAQDREANDWLYDVTVNPKHDSRPEPDDDTITRRVLKIWEDEGHEKERPREVIVQLLRDGKVYDTVTLNADNNWRRTWKDLDDRYTWTVAEKALEDYNVTVTREGVTFVVTNTYSGDGSGHSSSTDSAPSSGPGTTAEFRLPQTGLLWWPVPVLLTGGLLLIVLGLLRRRRDGNEE